MTMTLRNAGFTVRIFGNRAFCKLARVGTQAHRAAVVFPREFLHLLRQNGDDGMRGLRIYLCRMSARESRDVAGEFHRHQLHAVTEPEIRDFVLACEFNRGNFAFYPRLSESARNEDAVILLEL